MRWPSLRFQSSMPSLVRSAWNTPLQSPKYTTPSTTAGVLVTAERPSNRQRGASWATLSGDSCVSAILFRLLSWSWLNTGHSSATGGVVAVGVAVTVAARVSVGVVVAVSVGGSVTVEVAVSVRLAVAVGGAVAVDVCDAVAVDKGTGVKVEVGTVCVAVPAGAG